jgi:UPF0271 protein
VNAPRFAVEPFGDAAIRVRIPEDDAAIDRRALLAALRAHPRVVDAVVTEAHALVTFDPAAVPARLEQVIEAAIRGTTAAGDAPRTHTVRVRYDGEDVDAVASAVGRSVPDLVALHTGRVYTVATIGFLPGFAYLRGLDPALVIPRRGTPRRRVAPGSVAIAGPYTGIYPFSSPGGWNLLGTAVDFAPFDPVQGARLALGDAVRFVAEVP